jgi:hypothetical protein
MALLVFLFPFPVPCSPSRPRRLSHVVAARRHNGWQPVPIPRYPPPPPVPPPSLPPSYAISAWCTVYVQGVGVVGLWDLRHLKDLDLSGNPDLSPVEVVACLTGRQWRPPLPELGCERDADPLHALESVKLGVQPTVRGAGKVRRVGW